LAVASRAIRYAHKLAGHALPTDAEGVKATMRGIRRTYAQWQGPRSPCGGWQDVEHGCNGAGTARRPKSRALLLVGFGGALRRSELVAVDVADIEETETGLLVKIRAARRTRSAKASLSQSPRVTLHAQPGHCGSG